MSETDAIPEFKKSVGAGGDVGIASMSALTSGPGIKSMGEVLAIVLVAVFIIGGAEVLLNIFAGAAIRAAQAERDRCRARHRLPVHPAASRATRWSSCSSASASAPWSG